MQYFYQESVNMNEILNITLNTTIKHGTFAKTVQKVVLKCVEMDKIEYCTQLKGTQISKHSEKCKGYANLA